MRYKKNNILLSVDAESQAKEKTSAELAEYWQQFAVESRSN